MGHRQEETINQIIVNVVTNTLLPFFSWFLCQLSWAMCGCKWTILLRHPSMAYEEQVMDSWGDQFSLGEILSFQTASGRRRYRKRLKKMMAPFLHDLRRSQECILGRRRFGEKLNQLAEEVGEIPRKATIEFDIANADKRIDEQFSSYSLNDVLDTFPIGKTVENSLRKRIASEVGDYPQTVLGLLWQASHGWNVIRQIKISKNSRIWALLRIDPDDEPDIEDLIDRSVDFALGKMDGDKLLCLARWVMGRMLISQFISHAYSDKHFVSLETPVADDMRLEDVLADDTAQESYNRIEELDTLDNALRELPDAQREAADLFLQANSNEELRQKLGDKKYKTKQRNFERALKGLEDLRKSGRLFPE